MNTSDFSYHLPPEQVAQTPIEPRDHSRLLVLNRKTGEIQHRRFYEISEFLHTSDRLVMNSSKVFKARFRGTIRATGKSIEIFLLRPEGSNWLALGKPGRYLTPGTEIQIQDQTATIQEKNPDGTLRIDFQSDSDAVFQLTDQIGEVPLPPYIQTPANLDRYQTIYADQIGSVAAPTAGLHFTPELIQKLQRHNIATSTITLHVGFGTFRPMQTETLEEHEMHHEWIHVTQKTRNEIAETKKRRGRIIAVGTTTVRALESDQSEGLTNLFITPGFRFKTVDALITNFHLPKSTLLVLVSSFIAEAHPDNPDRGRQIALATYHTAIQEGYRFYSFGDAMLII